MTRKESDALLREMRKTGRVAKLKQYYEQCIVQSAEGYAKVDGEYVFFVFYGETACGNTFKEFYGSVSKMDFIEMMPEGFHTYGLPW